MLASFSACLGGDLPCLSQLDDSSDCTPSRKVGPELVSVQEGRSHASGRKLYVQELSSGFIWGRLDGRGLCQFLYAVGGACSRFRFLPSLSELH